MRKIGIFGGTFNPIHNGHIKAAEEILSLLRLDEIIFIPNKLPPHKEVEFSTDEHDRLNMVHLATKNNPNFVASDIELRREGPSYTYDTIAALKKIYPNDKLYFIAGVESLINYKWYRLDDLLSLLEKFLVIKRHGIKDAHISSVLKGSNLSNAGKIQPIEIKTDVLSMSSSRIREKIINNKPLGGILPEEVIEYINEKKLYR